MEKTMNLHEERRLRLEALRFAKAHDSERFADVDIAPEVRAQDLYHSGTHEHTRAGGRAPSTPAWSEADRSYYRAGKLAALRRAAERDPGRFGPLAEAAGKESGDVEAAYRELLRAVRAGV
jgi:hypothetical protein